MDRIRMFRIRHSIHPKHVPTHKGFIMEDKLVLPRKNHTGNTLKLVTDCLLMYDFLFEGAMWTRIPVNCRLLMPTVVEAAMPEATAAMALLARVTTAAAVAVMALEATAAVVPTMYRI